MFILLCKAVGMNKRFLFIGMLVLVLIGGVFAGRTSIVIDGVEYSPYLYNDGGTPGDDSDDTMVLMKGTYVSVQQQRIVKEVYGKNDLMTGIYSKSQQGLEDIANTLRSGGSVTVYENGQIKEVSTKNFEFQIKPKDVSSGDVVPGTIPQGTIVMNSDETYTEQRSTSEQLKDKGMGVVSDAVDSAKKFCE